MVLQNSGSISLLDIQNEFGGTTPIGLDQYYRNGGYVPSNNTNVPVSGSIGFSNFYGAVREVVVYITSTSTNVSGYSLFGSYWQQNIPKRLVINSGVTLGASDRTRYALDLENLMSGTLIVDNYGSILGAGGYANGGSGGSAIAIASNGVSINNQGFIYAGGGGGGQGGVGGQGGWGLYQTIQTLGNGTLVLPNLSCNTSCQNKYGGDGRVGDHWYYIRCVSGCFLVNGIICTNCQRFDDYYYSGGQGGQGGSGGTGIGYNNSTLTGLSGSAGNPPFGYGAGYGGQGGTGGNGGDWGSYGYTGGTGFIGANGNNTGGYEGGGGQTGGSPGYYIVRLNGSTFSWINVGTIAGWLS